MIKRKERLISSRPLALVHPIDNEFRPFLNYETLDSEKYLSNLKLGLVSYIID